MAASITPLTIDDFERLPAERTRNRELVEGELIDVSGNTPYHNWLRDLLIELLKPFVREHALGKVVAEQEYDFDGNVHAPDVTFSRKAALFDPKKRVQRFVPDLAIEIVSQNDSFDALWKKKERYRSCGTVEVWIISPESREVFAYTQNGNRILGEADQLASAQIPGFSIAVGELLDRARL